VKSIGNTNINTLAKNYCQYQYQYCIDDTNTNTFTGNTFSPHSAITGAFKKGSSWLRFFFPLSVW